jgi:hypothetical protein
MPVPGLLASSGRRNYGFEFQTAKIFCRKAVIASEAKQSMRQHQERMDCFVASLLAMTPRKLKHTFAFSRRDAPELCRKFAPSDNRGRRECRAPDAPAAARGV